jgi:hypothetical protein
MSIEIFDFPQNSPEWREAHRGVVTASEFGTVLASGRGGGESKTRTTYMRKLAGEIICGQIAESFTTAVFDRGHAMEEDARKYYAFVEDVEPQQVGFIKNSALRVGYSPDFLIGSNGAGEIKSKAPHLLIDWLFADKFPAEHVPQCQGGLWVSEREWIDIIGFYTRMPVFKKRAYRDELFIKRLAEEVELFNEELDTLVAKVRAYGQEGAAA